MVGFAEKLNIQHCGNSTGNSEHYMSGISGFAEKLNIPNSENSKGNCVHYLCTAIPDLQENWKSKTAEIQFEVVYNTCTECLDSRKIEHPKLRKFDRKLCTLYLYKMFGFAENLIV